MDERLRRIRHAEQRVARRRDLAQPVADHEQDVGVAHALREPGVGAEGEVADVGVRAVVDVVLAAPARGDRERARGAPGRQSRVRLGAPWRAADDDERPLRPGEELSGPLDVARDPDGRGRSRPASRPRRRIPRRACPPAARARPAPGGRRWRRGRRARRARGSGRDRRSARPTSPSARTCGGSRSPGMPPAPSSRGRPGRSGGSAGSSPGRRCGCPPAACVAPGPRVTMQMPGRPVSLP